MEKDPCLELAGAKSTLVQVTVWCLEATSHNLSQCWPSYLSPYGVTGPQRVTWASYQIRKIAGCACAGNAGNVSPRRRIQRKTRVSDPGMHHDTCVTHVPWCMSGLLTRGGGENVPGIPGACAPAIWRIWQEAHSARLKCTIPCVFLLASIFSFLQNFSQSLPALAVAFIPSTQKYKGS